MQSSSFSSSFRKGSRPSLYFMMLVMGVPGIFAAANLAAQRPALQELSIDASRSNKEPGPALYDLSSNRSPSGETLGVNSRYLTRNGKPFLPVMGEFHYSRVPRAQWEDELLKMKAAGVNIVAAYVIWIHHEEIEGQFDWSGQRDLRAFAQLCAKHGLLLEPRIGPWAHAEARNGGLPDWVLKEGPTRVNDPKYLASVSRFYGEIGRQLKGMMWKDGGPVMAIQLENEYAKRGAGAGEEHILTLKKMAIDSGMDVPFWFVTGWDNAVVPKRAVIPVYGGGYPDAPWDGSTSKLPPGEVYAFRFRSRVAANMGAIGAKHKNQEDLSAIRPVPYLTAEIGGGIEDTYHRRPVIQPDDIGAMFPVMLGSGVNLYGSYMFHGGENPDGRQSTLQESQATGYPNDLPIKSYDFQAPIGEYGEERASLGRMKVYQYFLNSFGEDLAPMEVHAPAVEPHDPSDFSVLRAAVRSLGESGFLFCNNYVRNYTMPERKSVQFTVALPHGALKVPSEPVTIPSGAYFIWPIHQKLGSADLVYSTAQPFTRLDGSRTQWVYAAVRGIPAEFAFADVVVVKASSGNIEKKDGIWYLHNVVPGVSTWIEVEEKSGSRQRLLVLSAEEAEHAWRVKPDGRARLLITDQDVIVDDNGQARLHARGEAHFGFTLIPAPEKTPEASLPLTAEKPVGSYTASATVRNLQPEVKELQAAGEAAPVRLSPPPAWRSQGVAQAPGEGELPQAAKWQIGIPQGALEGLSEAWLELRYQGDVARLSADGKLLVDDFFNGLDWRIGLKRYLSDGGAKTLELSILPLRKDAPVYFETPHAVEFGPNGQAVRLESVRLIPEYELRLGAK